MTQLNIDTHPFTKEGVSLLFCRHTMESQLSKEMAPSVSKTGHLSSNPFQQRMEPSLFWVNNYIAENRFRMRRTRHVQVKCLKLQEWIQDKTIKLLKVPSAENLADWFTKGSILVQNFMYCRDKVMSLVESAALD